MSEPTPVETKPYEKEVPKMRATKITIASLQAVGARLRVREANARLARLAPAPASAARSRGRR